MGQKNFSVKDPDGLNEHPYFIESHRLSVKINLVVSFFKEETLDLKSTIRKLNTINAHLTFYFGTSG